MQRLPSLLALLVVGVAPHAAHGFLPPAAERLANLINQHRAENGLPPVPLSRSLTRVAEAHVADSERTEFSGPCNLHSWSNSGDWTGCCYSWPPTPQQSSCMWDKPREITGGRYGGSGFEISHGARGGRVTPDTAIQGWKTSSAHNDVILNRSIWADARWQAMGVALSGSYAHVWFGKEPDPDVGAAPAARSGGRSSDSGAEATTVAQAAGRFVPGDRYYRLQTMFLESQGKCLEGNRPGRDAPLAGAAYQDDCARASGQRWRFVPTSDGHYRLQTMYLEKQGLCLEGGRGAAANSPATMAPCADVTGQIWKLVPARDGYFRLQTLYLERQNMCLEGGRGIGHDSPAAQTPCSNVTGQLWRFSTD